MRWILLIFVGLKKQRFMLQKVGNSLFSYYRFEHLAERTELIHFISSGDHTIGFSEQQTAATICYNRKLLAETVGFEVNNLVTGHQVHGTHVAVVGKDDAGKGALNAESRFPNTDALVTDCEGVCLMVLSADCVPVLFYDPSRRVIAAAHAGWRGTAANIVGEVVAKMQQHWKCEPKNILAAIGPSIGPCCFEVDEEVAAVFRTSYPDMVHAGICEGKYQVDLWNVNRYELLKAGLVDSNIEVAEVCTVCSRESFFSYRRQGKTAGRFGAGICLRHS